MGTGSDGISRQGSGHPLRGLLVTKYFSLPAAKAIMSNLGRIHDYLKCLWTLNRVIFLYQKKWLYAWGVFFYVVWELIHGGIEVNYGMYSYIHLVG